MCLRDMVSVFRYVCVYIYIYFFMYIYICTYIYTHVYLPMITKIPTVVSRKQDHGSVCEFHRPFSGSWCFKHCATSLGFADAAAESFVVRCRHVLHLLVLCAQNAR